MEQNEVPYGTREVPKKQFSQGVGEVPWGRRQFP
jgi:hypothetical protein